MAHWDVSAFHPSTYELEPQIAAGQARILIDLAGEFVVAARGYVERSRE